MSLSGIRIHIGKEHDGLDLSVKEAGQIIVIFALMLTVLIGLVGIAIDVTYAWRNGLQIQRAADAAAMAGVVYLPGDLDPDGRTKATSIASANGYTAGGGTTVVVDHAPLDERKMDVTITTPVPTFFIRLFGINQWTISRTARAAFVMPVPMGSPLNYLGIGCLALTSFATQPPCDTATTSYTHSGVTPTGTSSTSASQLDTLGAWTAVITRGGDQGNGDAYLPTHNGSPLHVNTGGNNVSYDPAGYYYTVVIPAGAAGGIVQLFDPGFCAMATRGSSFWGTGDHIIGGTTNPVSTWFRLLNTEGQPLNPTAWDTANGGVAWSHRWENLTGTDAAGNCSANASHNAWYTLAQNLSPGQYEVEVTTSSPFGDAADNADVNAENNFGIMATVTTPAPSGISPQVYGYDKMAVYNNLATTNALQQFYIAQVSKDAGAGKTLTIDLFDVGDSTAGTLSILSPDGGTAHTVPFTYTTFSYDSSGARVLNNASNCANNPAPCSVGVPGVSSVIVKNATNQSFNDTWLEISIPLLPTYGTTLWNQGWWQVQYQVTAGNDTTTWSVNVNGNPVRLVPVTNGPTPTP
jgi:hypothetical protein